MPDANAGAVIASEAPLERLAIEKSLRYQFVDRSLLAQVHLSPTASHGRLAGRLTQMTSAWLHVA